MIRNKLQGVAGRRAQETARRYLESSCEQGHAASFLYLGMVHELGIGGPVNLEKAQENYNLSKDAGDPQGYFKLAQIAEAAGESEEYLRLMKGSAENGLLEGQHSLAVYYLSKDEVMKAMAWLLQAAKFDFYPSMVNLGSLFLLGRGPLLSNPLAALIWLKRAQKIENSQQLTEMVAKAEELVNSYQR